MGVTKSPRPTPHPVWGMGMPRAEGDPRALVLPGIPAGSLSDHAWAL